jgi:hypothetical protein
MLHTTNSRYCDPCECVPQHASDPHCLLYMCAHRYGGWARFQELLRALKDVADKHATSVQVSQDVTRGCGAG